MIDEKVQLMTIFDMLNMYIIKLPSYQRIYTWGKYEIEQFLDDIYEHTKNNNDYYIGNVFAYNEQNTKNISVIDGQQRVTTLILILNAIRLLNNDLFVKIGVDFFDGQKPKFDTESSSPFCNDLLSLENINVIKKSMIAEDKQDFTKMNLYYGQKIIIEYFKKRSDYSIISSLLKNVKFIMILCNRQEDGYLVFENINSKGVSLSNSDLIKSAFFNRIDSERTSSEFRTKKYIKWREIENNYFPKLKEKDTYKTINSKNKKSISNFEDLFNYYHIMNNGERISSNSYKLYREYLKKMDTMSSGQLLNELNNLLDVSKSFSFVYNYKEKSIPDLEEFRLAILFLSCFNMKQYIPFALSIITQLNLEERKYRSSRKKLYKLFYRIALFHFVFNRLMSQRPSKIGNFYNELSKKIYVDKITVNSIENDLNIMINNVFSKLYDISKKEERIKFVNKCIESMNFIVFDTDRSKGLLPKNKKYKKINGTDELKFIFGAIESYLKNDYSIKPTVDSVEHIQSLSGEEKKRYDNYTIFNCLPLEERINHDLEDKKIEEKIKQYNNSNYKLMKNYCKLYSQYNGDMDEVTKKWNEEIVRIILSIIFDKEITW